ncbi:MAG TPA: asparagine synthetase B [Candidatus Bathyarchaeia archaeon]
MKTAITALSKTNEQILAKIIAALKKLDPSQTHIATAIPSSSALELNPNQQQISKTDSPVVYCYAATQTNNIPEIFKLKNSTLIFQGRIYRPIQTESFWKTVSERTELDRSAEVLLKKAEGDFCFSILKPDSILTGRDPMGIEPWYYGENSQIAALASNRRALWQLGIAEPKSFPPGHLAHVSHTGFEFKPIKTLHYKKPKHITMKEAATRLQTLLESSVRNRTRDLKKVAIAFSGGLDSSLLAALTKKSKIDVHLIYISLENLPETESAIKAAEELNLNLHLALFKESDLAKTLPRVVEIIEEADPVKAAVGLPFYWVAQEAAQEGFRVMLAGQGADELFGGYQRYVNTYIEQGNEHTRKIMFNDATKLYESNIERDVKICRYHNVELRLPFASFQLAKFALQLPIELKLENKKDTARKLVLREAANYIGLSQMIVHKKKKAVQYSTGVNNAIRKLAQKEKFSTKEFIEKQFQNSKKANTLL